jgi:ubiquinone biosynthesis accessory factor UbiK
MNRPDPSAFFTELQQKLKTLAENSPAKDIEKNARAFGASMASRLDLVPREELDAALRQLGAARLKLDELEKRIAALEAK